MENNRFDTDFIVKLAREMYENSSIPYEELPRYDLFLSQVIDFLNDKFEGENYTNNIVQNYVKSEVISKPEDGKKRGYTKMHLVQLALLSYMRPVLTTEEIKKVFSLAFNDINERTDDIISWETAYKAFVDMQKESFDKFIKSQYYNEDMLKNIISESKLKTDDEDRIKVFLIVMTLVAQASAIKKLAKDIVDKYQEN